MGKRGPRPKSLSEVRSYHLHVRLRPDSGAVLEALAAEKSLKASQLVRHILFDLVNPGGPRKEKGWYAKIVEKEVEYNSGAPVYESVRELRAELDSQVRGAVERSQGLDVVPEPPSGEEFAF